MNCNCIKDIEQKVLDRKVYDNRSILSAKMLGYSYMMPSFEIVTNTEIELELEGLKKPKTVNMMHSYCPFCGTKIKKEENTST